MINIPAARLKKEFRQGFHEYIKKMGRDIVVHLKPFSVDCPNCLRDSVRKTSANVYDQSFVRPVNIFPGTFAERLIYPAPFNVTTVSGVQYDPSLLDPKILKTTVCPVCKGEGILVYEDQTIIRGVVTWNPREELRDLSPGYDGESICRVKTYEYNYSVVRDAKYFIVDGVKCEHSRVGTPRVKGLGADHITEFYLTATEIGKSVSDNYNLDDRLDSNPIGRVSDQAGISTPTIPPQVPGEDVW